MSTLRSFFGVILGIGLLGALAVGGYFALQFGLDLFGTLEPQVATMTAIASIVALLVALIIASGIRQASRQNKANLLHAEKVATYQLFADIWARLLQQGRRPEDDNSPQFSAELQALDCFLALYGSPGVIKANATLRMQERDSGLQNQNTRSQFAKVLLEIRKDFGTEVRGLTAEELLPIFLADSKKETVPAKASTYNDLQPRISLPSPEKVR